MLSTTMQRYRLWKNLPIPLVPTPDVSKPQKEPKQNPETSTEKVQNPKLENTAHVPSPGEEDSIFIEIPKPKETETKRNFLEEIAITTVNAECFAIIMNKVPEELEDPGKFLIPVILFTHESRREAFNLPARNDSEFEDYLNLMTVLYEISTSQGNVHQNSVIESLPISPIPVEDSEPTQEEIDIFPYSNDLISTKC
ncbi:hypothetical protein Tco_0290068 [Tanacetum coccineum]